MTYILLWGQHTHIDQQNVLDMDMYFNIESIYVYILNVIPPKSFRLKDDIVNVL